MAGARIELELSGLALVQQRLHQLTEKTEDMQLAFELIGQALELSHRERWDREESPDGTPWTPLSEVTRKIKKRHQNDILLYTSTLRDTLAYQASPHELLFGSNEEYAATHQFGAKQGAFGKNRRGSPIPWGDIPARPFLGISSDDQASILDILEQYLLPE